MTNKNQNTLLKFPVYPSYKFPVEYYKHFLKYFSLSSLFIKICTNYEKKIIKMMKSSKSWLLSERG